MGVIANITNWWWIMKNNKKSLKAVSSETKARVFLKQIFYVAKNYRKGGRFRNAVTWHIKDVRKRYPYEVQDYSVAKALYEQYWTIPTYIESYQRLYEKLLKALWKGERIFIHYFRFEYPVKSKDKYERYYINGAGGGKPTTLEVRLDNETREVQARTFRGNWEKFYLESEPERITQYLWADEDQINRFEERAIQFSFLQGEKAKAMEEVCKIEKEIQAV